MIMTTHRPAVASMYAGLALTLVALATLYVDHLTGNVLAAHVHAGYPAYPPAGVDAAVTAYLAYLTVVGLLGVAAWLATIRAVASGARWARPVATAFFAVGTALALADLSVRDTSGDTGLPLLLGGVGMLPSVAGLAAVLLLWRRPATRRAG